MQRALGMTTHLTEFPYQSGRIYRSRTFLLSILQKTVIGHSNSSHPHLFICLAATSVNNSRCMRLSVKSTADGARSVGPQSSKNTTRLIRTVQSLQRKLSSRIKDLRNGLSVKVLFFLIGFYCATAFATVIGQTGDWDILSAGLAMFVVEGIGAMTYRSSSRFFDKVRSLVAVFNYWKAGLTLGLFLDSFKYEVDSLLEKCNPFNIDIDIFQILL